jgi:hypothetical protein
MSVVDDGRYTNWRRTWHVAVAVTILAMSDQRNPRLDRVLQQLRLYEHPLLSFSAQPKGEGVEVSIQLMHCTVPVHTYLYEMHPRDLDHPQFEWQFQRQLYDALHDYLVEMFIRTPQDRIDRRERGL